MAIDDPPYAADDAGVWLTIRLTPRSSRNAVDGIVRGADGRTALQLRLNAPPVDGAANAALIAYLAKILGMRKSSVVLRSGHTARLKRLHLAGDPAAILMRLTGLEQMSPLPVE